MKRWPTRKAFAAWLAGDWRRRIQRVDVARPVGETDEAAALEAMRDAGFAPGRSYRTGICVSWWMRPESSRRRDVMYPDQSLSAAIEKMGAPRWTLFP